MAKKIYRVEDVAKKLNVSTRSIFRYIHSGKLRATKIGHWRIDDEDIQRFLRESNNFNNK